MNEDDIMSKAEIWKPVSNYVGIYEISNYGRVLSLAHKIHYTRHKPYVKKNVVCTVKPKIKAEHKDRYGYLVVSLEKYAVLKNFLVHRLVGKAFLPNPHHLPDINHKNEDRTDNRVSNLEWCSRKYNINYGNRSLKMHLTKIKKLSKSLDKSLMSVHDIHILKKILFDINDMHYMKK